VIGYCGSDVSILGLASEQRRVVVAGLVLGEVEEKIVNERGAVTAKMALRLSRAFKTTPHV